MLADVWHDDACIADERVWPSTVVHDHSDEPDAAADDTMSTGGASGEGKEGKGEGTAEVWVTGRGLELGLGLGRFQISGLYFELEGGLARKRTMVLQEERSTLRPRRLVNHQCRGLD